MRSVTPFLPAVVAAALVGPLGAADDESATKDDAAGAVIGLMEIARVKDIPDAVLKAIDDRADGARLTDIERKEKDDAVLYEVQLTQGAKEWQLRIAEDGLLIADTKHDEAIDELPAEVKRALMGAVGDDQVVDVDRDKDDGKVFYEAKIRGESGSRTLRFSDKGELVDATK
ncbi:MAG TPA: PepSY-like domain-containing protein [Planctomycetota bacterium]|nr:PepSY-like domain-containing protein [Planctomycetota bacterium]